MTGKAAEDDGPYKGLDPFTEKDAVYFFGRETWRDIIVNNLKAARLTVLYGASGVGKSSVLRAGVVHLLNETARQNMERFGCPKIAVVYFREWGGDHLLRLKQQIQDKLKSQFAGQTIEPPQTSLSFDDFLTEWTNRIGGDGRNGRLFIILDQFEDYFLYDASGSGQGAFETEFPAALKRPDLAVNFLISVREDSLSKLDHFKGSIPNLWGNRLEIQYLDFDSARDAIRKPVEEYNRLYWGKLAPVSVEPGLIESVIKDVRAGQNPLGGKGQGRLEFGPKTDTDGQVETPYLQIVMTRLWREEMASGCLRKITYDTMGGAKKIIKQHLHVRMARLGEKNPVDKLAEEYPGKSKLDALANMFNYLVTPSGTKIPQSVYDLVRSVNAEPDHLIDLEEVKTHKLLIELCKEDSRIFRELPPARKSDIGKDFRERYEIYHDALADAVLDWRRQHLEKRKIEIENAVEKARLRKRRKKFLMFGVPIGLTILLLCLFVLCYLVFPYISVKAATAVKNGYNSLEKNDIQIAETEFRGSLWWEFLALGYLHLPASHNGLGQIFMNKGEFNAAKDEFYKAIVSIEAEQKILDTKIKSINDPQNESEIAERELYKDQQDQNSLNLSLYYLNYAESFLALEDKESAKNWFIRSLGESAIFDEKARRYREDMEKKERTDRDHHAQYQARVYTGLFGCNLSDKDRTEMIAHLNKSIQKDPSDPRPHTLIAEIYSDLGDYDKAIPEFEKAINNDPRYTPLLFNVADLYCRKRDFSKACEYFRSAEERTINSGLPQTDKFRVFKHALEKKLKPYCKWH